MSSFSYNEEETEQQAHLSTYLQYLSDDWESDNFVYSLKKNQDSSWEKSFYNKTLSLQKSFDSNINNSFLCYSNEDEKKRKF